MMLQTLPEGQISALSSQCILIVLNGPDSTFPLSSLRIAPNPNKIRVRHSKPLRMKHHSFYCYLLLLEKHYTFAGCFALLSWLFRSIFVLRQEKCLGFLKYFHLLSAAQTQTLYLWECVCQLLPRHYSLSIQRHVICSNFSRPASCG